MNIHSSQFITSAARKDQYIEADLPEVAFIGRSNVGKSSLINALTNRRKLARVSNTPGRTRLVNFFLLNDAFVLVDLPGYGYAKVSKGIKAELGSVLDDYFTHRDALKKVALLVDSRHVPSKDDVLMYEYIKHFNIPCLVIGTKMDKLKRNEIKKNEQIIRKQLCMDPSETFLMYSSESKENHDKLLSLVFDDLMEE